MRDKDFVILPTQERSNDLSVKNFIGQNVPVAIYKMEYVPPYGQFDELKAFQLKMRYVPFKPRYRHAAVDVTEWLGHETDEYFDIAMRFFHDCRECNYIFTARDAESEDIKQLYDKISEYMDGYINHTKQPSREAALTKKKESRGAEHERG